MYLIPQFKILQPTLPSQTDITLWGAIAGKYSEKDLLNNRVIIVVGERKTPTLTTCGAS